jgi:hypothetical protein
MGYKKIEIEFWCMIFCMSNEGLSEDNGVEQM